MFQAMIMVAIPVLVTLTAAFFIFRSIANEEQAARGQHHPPRSAFARQNQGGGADRQESDVLRGTRRRNVSSAPSSSRTEECVVCFEDRVMVEIYPCGHRSVCESCVNEIICANKRACPLCRRKIQGYSNAM